MYLRQIAHYRRHCQIEKRVSIYNERLTSSIEEASMAKELDLSLVIPGNQNKLYGELSYSLSVNESPLLAGLIAAFIREHGYSVKVA